ncbi:MAG: hypothetical protein O9972_26065 [Burkholderiales bacterium]|nr:hypothetical protein [Burkholderiales bacterium]
MGEGPRVTRSIDRSPAHDPARQGRGLHTTPGRRGPMGGACLAAGGRGGPPRPAPGRVIASGGSAGAPVRAAPDPPPSRPTGRPP